MNVAAMIVCVALVTAAAARSLPLTDLLASVGAARSHASVILIFAVRAIKSDSLVRPFIRDFCCYCCCT